MQHDSSLVQMIRQAGNPLVKAGAGAAVFGNCDVADESLAPALRAAAAAIWSGAPAAVAPLRPLEPETASRFAEEFYNHATFQLPFLLVV